MPDVQTPTKQQAPAPVRAEAQSPQPRDVTIVAHSGDMDKLMAALIIATGAAASGKRVSIFFTFWGLNALRAGRPGKGKPFLERMIGWMMPRGPAQLPASRMQMGGLGPRFFRHLMKRKGVDGVPQMLDLCDELEVQMIACRMSMDLLGIREEEIRDNVTYAGVAKYLLDAQGSSHNLFI